MWRVPEAPQGLAMGPVAVAGWGRWQWRAGSREKLRPARPLQRPTREIVRPASAKTPILGCFERAGRTISRSHPPPDHAGRTFSRTGRTEVVTVKPTTPLQPLMQTSVKPPSPMLAREQHPLKPATPMQAKNAPKTPNSHPQRRYRFQLRLSRRPQRRCRFQTTGPHRHAGRRRDRKAMPQSPWAAAGPGRATSGRPTLQTSSNWCILKPSLRTRVTNIVNLRPKTTIFRKNAVGLTTFVTTRAEPDNSDRAPLVWRAPEGPEGTGELQNAGPSRGAGGRWQGQGGPRDRPLRAAGSRVAISRAGRRPPAHTAARPSKAGHAAGRRSVEATSNAKPPGPIGTRRHTHQATAVRSRGSADTPRRAVAAVRDGDAGGGQAVA